MNAIQTNKLTKSYGKSRGIIDISLTVEKGGFFGFIGPNGAGKSTTIRTLLGLIKPTSGKASVLGCDIVNDKIEILGRTGYMPSEAVFYNGMKVKDVLRFSASLRKKECSKQANELCEQLNLDISRNVDDLSFGNRKKVGIVCALQHSPELLILDEPTSGLDPLIQRKFFEILRERNNEGTTVFLSSHVLSEIQHYCRDAAIIREGKMIACDKVENLSRTNAKRVTVHGSFNAEMISGVKDIQNSADGVSFLYSGDINELINKLSRVHITDLTIAEPDLEEIFMHFYTNGGEAE